MQKQNLSTFAGKDGHSPLVTGMAVHHQISLHNESIKVRRDISRFRKKHSECQTYCRKEARSQPIVVVVSALGGITDQLISTSQLAKDGNEEWKRSYEAMVDRHHKAHRHHHHRYR